jgi:predicted nucleic acid-binding protein
MSVLRFLDTNILLYSISTDPTEAAKRAIAIALLEADDVALSVQVLQEFYVQATRPTRPDAVASAEVRAAGWGGLQALHEDQGARPRRSVAA